MKKKTGVVLSSVAAIALSASLIAGSTFALFTSESKTNIAVTSGKVNVEANIDGTYEYTYDTSALTAANDKLEVVPTEDGRGISLNYIAPGDTVKFDIIVNNTSTIAVKYATTFECTEGFLLMYGLDVSVDGKDYSKAKSVTTAYVDAKEGEFRIPVTVSLAANKGNGYSGLSTSIAFAVNAIQSNAKVSNEDKIEYISDSYETLAQANKEGKLTTVNAESSPKTVAAMVGNLNSEYVVLEEDFQSPYSLGTKYSADTKGLEKVIDLNGHTLEITPAQATGFAIAPQGFGSLKIMNGKIVSNSTMGITNIWDESQFSMENVEIVSTKQAQYFFNENGSASTKPNISFKNCKFVAEEPVAYGAYLPSSGAVREFINCEFIGKFYSSLLINGGQTTIEGGVYVGAPTLKVVDDTFAFLSSILGKEDSSVRGFYGEDDYAVDYVRRIAFPNTGDAASGPRTMGDAIIIIENRRDTSYLLDGVTINNATIKVGETAPGETFATGTYTSGALSYGIRHLNYVRENGTNAEIAVNNVTYYQGNHVVTELSMNGGAIKLNPFVHYLYDQNEGLSKLN